MLHRSSICRHYCAGWFAIDFFSVLPFFLITLDYTQPWPAGDSLGGTAAAAAATAAAAAATAAAPVTLRPVIANASDDGSGMQASVLRATVLFRVVKLLRMLKLARVFKATRVMQRRLLDVAMNRWEWTFAVLKINKMVVMLSFFAHIQACLWGLISSYLEPPTWITRFDADVIANGEGPPAPLDRYWAALYWSARPHPKSSRPTTAHTRNTPVPHPTHTPPTPQDSIERAEGRVCSSIVLSGGRSTMTLTSIGYGEMTPQNSTERALCSLWMMLSGVMWTYVIGQVSSIATTLNPNRVAYENTMDALNYFMRERGLPKEMVCKLAPTPLHKRVLDHVPSPRGRDMYHPHCVRVPSPTSTSSA